MCVTGVVIAFPHHAKLFPIPTYQSYPTTTIPSLLFPYPSVLLWFTIPLPHCACLYLVLWDNTPPHPLYCAGSPQPTNIYLTLFLYPPLLTIAENMPLSCILHALLPAMVQHALYHFPPIHLTCLPPAVPAYLLICNSGSSTHTHHTPPPLFLPLLFACTFPTPFPHHIPLHFITLRTHTPLHTTFPVMPFTVGWCFCGFSGLSVSYAFPESPGVVGSASGTVGDRIHSSPPPFLHFLCSGWNGWWTWWWLFFPTPTTFPHPSCCCARPCVGWGDHHHPPLAPIACPQWVVLVPFSASLPDSPTDPQ